jgi:glycogen operon protein
MNEVEDRGSPIEDDDFLLLVNADDAEVAFALPLDPGTEEPWALLLDTSQARHARRLAEIAPGEACRLGGRSLALLVRPRGIE